MSNINKTKSNQSVRIIHWLDTGIFPATVMFSCGFEFEEIITLLKKKKASQWLFGIEDQKVFIESSNYCYVSTTLMDKKTKKETRLFYLIVKEVFRFTDFEYCKLAHEVLHICQHILKDILDRYKEHEAEAYLHTHLMQNILKELRK